MAIAYFDSSVLMSMLLREGLSKIAAGLWDQHPRRVSSLLLEAECWTGMRRHFLNSKVPASSAWIQERSKFLAGALASVQICPVDARIAAILKEREELAECRTLDALHLATALFFQSKDEDGLIVISFDQKMRQTAAKMKFDVLPTAI